MMDYIEMVQQESWESLSQMEVQTQSQQEII